MRRTRGTLERRLFELEARGPGPEAIRLAIRAHGGTGELPPVGNPLRELVESIATAGDLALASVPAADENEDTAAYPARDDGEQP